MCNFIAVFFRAMLLIAGIALHIYPHLYLALSPSEPEQLLSFQMLWGMFMQLLMFRRGQEEKWGRMPGGHLRLRNPQYTARKGTFKLWSSLPDQWIVKGLLATEAFPDVLGVGWGLECGEPEAGQGELGSVWQLKAMAGSLPWMPCFCMYFLFCSRVLSVGGGRMREL